MREIIDEEYLETPLEEEEEIKIPQLYFFIFCIIEISYIMFTYLKSSIKLKYINSNKKTFLNIRNYKT